MVHEIFTYVLLGLIGSIVLLFVLKQPYLGLVFTIATLPVIDLLPQIPLFLTIFPIIGMVTLGAYLLQTKRPQKKRTNKFDIVKLYGLLFIFWVVVSNPRAAFTAGDRNWLFTFLQLWILMALTGELLKDPEKQKIAMLIFAVASMVSAIFAIFQGNIAEDALSSARVAGLATNANQAARYFIVAMVFFYYLRTKINGSFARFLFLLGIIVTFLGVFFTVSRSGILLLFGACGLILILQPQLKNRAGLIALVIIGLLILSVFSDSIFRIIGSILPAIAKGTDTVGLRYNLWRAGWRMWLDHPFRGIGIGMYNTNLWRYMQGLIGPTRGHASSHNTYIQVLSETGIIGFILFMVMLVSSIKHLWPLKVSSQNDDDDLRHMWFIILIVISVGGLSITDLANKLLWMVMGVSIIYGNANLEAEQAPESQPPVLSTKKAYSSANRFTKGSSWQRRLR